MKRTIIDASQFELDRKSSINQTCIPRLLRVDVTCDFTALVVVGDGNGHVGAGLGKSN